MSSFFFFLVGMAPAHEVVGSLPADIVECFFAALIVCALRVITCACLHGGLALGQMGFFPSATMPTVASMSVIL